MLPAVVVRVLEGRSGSTLLTRLLSTSPEVVLDRRYPEGEYRYLSYCVRAADALTEPWREGVDPGVTELFFGDQARFGPLPFVPDSLDLAATRPRVVRRLWAAMSESMLERSPDARWYVEKVAVPVERIEGAGIPVRVIDCVRDPRDILASVRLFTAKSGHDGFGRRRGEPEASYVPRFVDSIRRQLAAMAGTPPTLERIVLRYEDFARDLDGCAATLGSWLDIDVEPAAVRFDPADRHVTATSVESSIGRWRTALPVPEAALIWRELGDDLTALGYQP